jgi:hypothetical protein
MITPRLKSRFLLINNLDMPNKFKRIILKISGEILGSQK